jgi:methylmalonyl-CoA mutase N-terminal domain/subunit
MPGSTLTNSRHSFRSFSTHTTICSKKSRSIALPAACGQKSCATASTPRTSAPFSCVSTRKPPENNIVRVAIQALAAVLGGCQSLHTNSLDEALALPTEDSALIALRTQQILAHETGVTNTIDPVAGSYAIEHLTNEIEKGAFEYIEKVDAMGGMLRAIDAGFAQGEIQKAAYEFQRAVEKKDQIVVGVNDFIAEEERKIPTLRVDPDIERSQIARLNALRARRDSARTKSALAELQRRAATSENLLPAILAAVEAYATVGEISDALRRVFGEYQESVVI